MAERVGCPVCGLPIPIETWYFCGASCEQANDERPNHLVLFDWDWYEHIENPPFVLQRCYGEFGW